MEAHGRKIEELVSEFVPINSAALDVGCGTGINTIKLKRKTDNVIGFDVKNYMKNPYRNKFKFVLGDDKKLPFNDSEFDIVTSWDVIEHVKNDFEFLKEIYRVLKPGGKAILSTPNRERLSNKLLRLSGKNIRYPYCLGKDGGVGEILHLREYLIKELQELSKKAGFKIIKAEGVFLGFCGFIRFGLFKVPKFFQNIAQHIFIVIEKPINLSKNIETNKNYHNLLVSEAKHWDEFEKEFIENKKAIPWWLDLRNASQYTEKGETIFNSAKEELIRGKYKKIIISECDEGESVLDIGCGSGWLSLELARKGCNVTAVDVSHYRIQLAREYYEKMKSKENFKGSVNYINSDIITADIPNNLNSIIAWDALHHLSNLDKLFSLLCEQKLKKNGKLICYDHIGSPFIETLGKFRHLFIKEKVSAFEDVSQEEILIYIKKYFNIIERKYKITAPFRIIDFLFFRYKIFKPLIPIAVKIDEFIANATRLFGGEFIYVKAIKK